MRLRWPPVITLDTPLAVHLCTAVGKGLLVIPEDATDDQFVATKDVLDAIEWEITDDIAGVNDDHAEVVELRGEPSDVLTIEALSGAQEQLLELSGLLRMG